MLRAVGILLIIVAAGDCLKRRLGLREPLVETLNLPKEQWFNQKLDHYKPTDLRTWQQRYYVNDTFFNGSPNSPVFLMIGGEGEASAKWMVAGAWIEYAQTFGALCFQLEHRFYGKSRPTEDMSVENLQFLNSEQALADLANFIVSMNAAYNLQNGNKWIAFGGSYPGSLAAWLRYKYPHLVHASISSSGPLLALADFRDYFEVVKASLGTSSIDCVSSVKMANKHLTKLLTDQSGGELLTKKFRLCSPLDVSNDNDVSNLAESLADNFAGIVQYNKDNRITSDPASKITIDDVCNIMTNTKLGDPIDRYAEVNNLLLRVTNQTCLNYTYEESIKDLSNTVWSNSSTEAGRQWTYQTCVEFGFYQTSTEESDLFGPNFPLKFFIQQCRDIFGEGFGKELLEEGINRTNTIYGDLHLKVKRVLFVHGSIDPWHALGIISSQNPDAPAVFIKGTAHCANMYPSKNDDLPQLKEARKTEIHYLKLWLNQDD
uniref:Prolylcarboxypeptidase, putative n=1 Tax=Riptortus pedestris TaxID=329032 RepID=R4WCS8_RIPPE|nr:prolylcarboxypeptidase, putative [Riptortus pedestris]